MYVQITNHILRKSPKIKFSEIRFLFNDISTICVL